MTRDVTHKTRIAPFNQVPARTINHNQSFCVGPKILDEKVCHVCAHANPHLHLEPVLWNKPVLIYSVSGTEPRSTFSTCSFVISEPPPHATRQREPTEEFVSGSRLKTQDTHLCLVDENKKGDVSHRCQFPFISPFLFSLQTRSPPFMVNGKSYLCPS